MPLTTGPCRTGQYAIFYQNLFQELGYKNVVVLSLNCDNSYSELGPDMNKRAWWAFVLADYMRDLDLAARVLAKEPEKARQLVREVVKDIVAAVAKGPAALSAGVAGWGDRLSKIELKRPVSEARKVLVVGEIFVRRDDFSVDPLLDQLAERGIVAKIAGLSEWVHYLDWEQVRKLKKSLAAMPLHKRILSQDARKLAKFKVELLWKRWVEHKIHKAFAKSGLLAELEGNMSFVMGRAEEFTTPELESEATLSPCSAAVAVEQGWDGIAIIAPFACLPGRLIEALYAPWSRERGIPVIALENDGNPYPPNVVSRIEIFAHNVSRGMRGRTAPLQPHQPAPAPTQSASGNGRSQAGNGNGKSTHVEPAPATDGATLPPPEREREREEAR
jgi:predicted nucleotide-binding protein (sugar kinase/HSP70/actin superfamily)